MKKTFLYFVSPFNEKKAQVGRGLLDMRAISAISDV